jgi:hypothetical protein
LSMGNVVKLGAFHRCPPQSVPDDIIDTSAARMKGLERDQKAIKMGGSIFEQQERRAGMAMASIEWEAYRLAALIGIAAAVEEIQTRIVKRLIEGIQP